MPVRVSNIRLPLDGAEEALRDEALRRSGVSLAEVASLEIVRRSLDRRRNRPVFCYTVNLHLNGEEPPSLSEPGVCVPRHADAAPLEHPPVVVGTGPAGLFAALHLAREGFRPVILERGDRMNHRVRRIKEINREGKLDPESNYLFGEGGAGTFSDGKLTSRSKDPRARFVVEEFRVRSGIPSVGYDYRPHLGSDRVRAVVGRLRQELVELGATFRFRCRVDRLELADGAVRGIATTEGSLAAPVVILAPGHSARDLYRQLHAQGVPMEQKPFQMGLRVEHPQEWVDRCVWGPWAGQESLGPADYRLAVRVADSTLFSFCMCPGGEIIPAISDLEHMNTNGMSWSGRSTGFANSGIVTTLEPPFGESGRGPLAGLELQARFEARAAAAVGGGLQVPAQCLGDYLKGRPSGSLPASSCRTGLVPAALSGLIPEVVDRILRRGLVEMDRQMHGFLHEDALLVGPESRSSSPVRLLRDPETLESPGVRGLLPVGEGAGFAGGIVSAAVDGLRAAQQVAARWCPPPR